MFYQDFKDTFVCNTQPAKVMAFFLLVVLSGFQRYFCMQYTTVQELSPWYACCFIRISKILLYAIHNFLLADEHFHTVVLSGFQRYFCLQYTTPSCLLRCNHPLFYLDFKDTFVCNTQLVAIIDRKIGGCFIRMSMNNSAAKVQKK